MKTKITTIMTITMILGMISLWIHHQNKNKNENTQLADKNTENAEPLSNEEVKKNEIDSSLNNEKQTITVTKSDECHRAKYRHLPVNQNREIEEFTHDLNAFAFSGQKLNPKSVCVRVNQKPVHHELKNRNTVTEVWIGSVVGPESEIEISYCTGKMTCKESCKIKSENKVDELINEEELAAIGDDALEAQVKELRSIASSRENLLDASVIRDWNQIGSNEWNCKIN
jgi:hypothetical protein